MYPPPSKRNNSHGFAHWEDLSDGVAVMEGTLILNIYKPQTEPQVFVREYMYILNIITGSTQFLSLINLWGRYIVHQNDAQILNIIPTIGQIQKLVPSHERVILEDTHISKHKP